MNFAQCSSFRTYGNGSSHIDIEYLCVLNRDLTIIIYMRACVCLDISYSTTKCCTVTNLTREGDITIVLDILEVAICIGSSTCSDNASNIWLQWRVFSKGCFACV